MVGYSCEVCKKKLYTDTIGPHYIKHHSEYLIENFKPYGRMSTPIAPYKGCHNFYLCLCCKQYHTSEARAKKHLEEKCSAEQQLEAIYTLIGTRPAKTTVTVKAEATKSDVGLINRIHAECSKVNALENEITRMKKQLQMERLKFKAYKEWAEKDRYIAVSLEKERYDTLRSRLVQDNGDGLAVHIQFTENLAVDEDDVHKLEALRMSYDCYNKGEMPATSDVLEVVIPPPPPKIVPVAQTIAADNSAAELSELRARIAKLEATTAEAEEDSDDMAVEINRLKEELKPYRHPAFQIMMARHDSVYKDIVAEWEANNAVARLENTIEESFVPFG